MTLLFVLVTSQAQALCGGKAIFEDTFDDNLSGWTEDEQKMISDGTYVFSPKNNSSVNNVIPAFFFGGNNNTICAESDIQILKGGFSGIIFWHVDWNDYYLVWYDDQSKELITSRYFDSKWNTIKTSNHNAGDEGEIDLKIGLRITGNIVSAFLNESESHKIRGQAPTGRFRIGLNGGRVEKIIFRDLRIAEESE